MAFSKSARGSCLRNERYAVDPAAPADSRQLKLLLDQFGLQTGRFLARYPYGWPKDVAARFDGLSQMEQQRVVDLLARRRACMVPTPPASFQPGLPWANNAALAVQGRVVDGVIGQPGNGFGWRSVDQVLYDEEASLPEGRGAHVEMRAPLYADCVRPLLAASAEVFLVDPYFTLRTKVGKCCARRWPVLQALLRAAESAGTCEVLRLVLDRHQIDDTHGSEHALVDDLESALAESGARRVSLEYDLRDSVGHGRYLFSIHGGLQFDQGFEEQRGQRNHIHWLSRPELDPLLDRYGRSTSRVMR